VSTPAPHEAVLRQAASLGRRHGKAAVYWQVGGSGSDTAHGFYRDLLAGIAAAGPDIMSLYQVAGLIAQHDDDRGNLAADLGLARDDPALAAAAEAYLAAAREEFRHEAARLARRRLRPVPGGGAGQLTAEPGPEAAQAPAEGQDGSEAEGTGRPQDITDPATGLSRLLSERCSTCILRPGDKMHLGPEQTAAFVRRALAEGTFVVCHQTLTYGDHPDFGPAICRGFFDAFAGRSPALRLLRAFGRLIEVAQPRPGRPADGEGR
jgi:hypothetical protein